jgi:hypothetical protein
MSAERSRLAETPTPADIVAGFMAALAIFADAVALVWHPLRILPLAIVLSLVAAAMSTRMRRLAGAAVALSAVCFFFGMTIAVIFKHKLW